MKDDDEWLGWISAMLFHAVGVSRTGTKALGHKRAYRGQNALLRWSVLGFFFVVVVVVVVVVGDGGGYALLRARLPREWE